MIYRFIDKADVFFTENPIWLVIKIGLIAGFLLFIIIEAVLRWMLRAPEEENFYNGMEDDFYDGM